MRRNGLRRRRVRSNAPARCPPRRSSRPPRGRTSLSEPCAALPSQAVMACVTGCDGAWNAAPVAECDPTPVSVQQSRAQPAPSRASPAEGRSSRGQPSGSTWLGEPYQHGVPASCTIRYVVDRSSSASTTWQSKCAHERASSATRVEDRGRRECEEVRWKGLQPQPTHPTCITTKKECTGLAGERSTEPTTAPTTIQMCPRDSVEYQTNKQTNN